MVVAFDSDWQPFIALLFTPIQLKRTSVQTSAITVTGTLLFIVAELHFNVTRLLLNLCTEREEEESRFTVSIVLQSFTLGFSRAVLMETSAYSIAYCTPCQGYIEPSAYSMLL